MADFTALDGSVEQPVEVVAPAKTKKPTPAYISDFIEKYKADNAIREEMNAWSDAIEVINTCGYGENGTIIQVERGTKVVDPNTGKTKSEGRELDTTSVIVGYVFKNVSEDLTIPYRTEVWSKEGDQIVSKEVEGQLAPGQTVALAKKWTTLFASQLQISNKFKNAKLIIQGVNKKPLEELLESAYITFTDSDLSVHSDDVKVPVADRVSEMKSGNKTVGVYKVKPEYFETFGFLDTKKEKTKANTSKEDIKGDIKSAAIASYIQSLANQPK